MQLSTALDGSQIAVVLVAVVAGALLKSISGLGLPLVAVPAITHVADIETAVAVTALPNLALNLALVWQTRANAAETRDLGVLAVTGFGGAVVGTLALVAAPDEPLIALLVGVVVAYAVVFFVAPSFTLDPDRARRMAPLPGFAAGLMQGAVGISGPIVAAWVHSYRLSRGAHVLSVTTLFACSGLAQLPVLVLSDRLAGLWLLSIVACVPALAPLPLGARLRSAFSSEGFDRFVVLTLLVSVLGLGVRTFT